MRLHSIASAIASQVRPAPNYPGYRVWTHGRVESCLKPGPGRKMYMTDQWRPLKTNDGRGRHYVTLYRDRKPKRVHVARLVLLAFVGQPEKPGMEARHYGEPDPANNNLSNLRWGTKKENSADAIRHGTQIRGEEVATGKLTWPEVREIRRLYAGGGWRYLDLALQFGVSIPTVAFVVKRKTWKDDPLEATKPQGGIDG